MANSIRALWPVPRSPVPTWPDLLRWVGPWSGAPTLVATVYVAAYLALFFARPASDQGALILSDFGEVPLEALAVGLALMVATREPRGNARAAWRLVALGLAGNLVANVLYGSYELAGQPPFPSLADGFYLSFYPLMLAGLLALPTASERRELFNWRVWSNVAIVLVGGGMALIHFILLPTIVDLTSEPIATVVSLAYPAGDLALLAALATVATRRPFASDRRAIGCFIVGVGVWFFADLAFAVESAAGTYAPGTPADLIWVAGDCAFLLAAYAQLRALPRVAAAEVGPTLTVGRAGPYLMLGVGLATLVAGAFDRPGEMPLLAVLAATLTLLVVLRQLVDEYHRRQAELALLAEHAAAAAQAAFQARQDGLTDLPNRRSLGETLRAELEASRLTGRPVTLVFLDLNRFKAVNDGLGHAAGDALLVEVGRRLRRSIRSGDVVARLGGDEFAIILPGTTLERGLELAERVRVAIERPYRIEEADLVVGAAFGVAVFPDGRAANDDELMHQADTAMYRAKRGHMGPTAYEPAFEDESGGLSILAELRSAIDGEGLFLLFQPIVGLDSRTTVAVEALARWRHPTRGLLSAPDFIPLASQTGLIRDLDSRVIDMACRQARDWLDSGMDVSVNVNISRDSLQDPSFEERFVRTMERYALPGAAVKLEMTEDGLLDRPDEAAILIEQLAARGVETAIDDFGTGFSSLLRLRDLRAQYLKVDQAFVRDAVRRPENAAIVEAVVALAHRLGMRVVAEGVEDDETLAYLSGLSVEYAQGFHLATPLEASAIAKRADIVRSASPVPGAARTTPLPSAIGSLPAAIGAVETA